MFGLTLPAACATRHFSRTGAWAVVQATVEVRAADGARTLDEGTASAVISHGEAPGGGMSEHGGRDEVGDAGADGNAGAGDADDGVAGHDAGGDDAVDGGAFGDVGV